TYLARNPDDADGHNLAGLAKRQLGDGAAAVAHLEKALALAPSETTYAINLAQILSDQGITDKALSVLDKALAASPGHGEALITRVLVLQRMGRITEAVAMARMTAAFHPTMARARHVLGSNLIKLRDYA